MMNANNPQTPGVYTVEKNAFPNSVAEVPTAIPAFLGYTEKAELNGKPLTKPLLINSMSEYEQHFGGAPINKYYIKLMPVSSDPVSGKKILPDYDVQINGSYYKIVAKSPTPAAKQNRFYMYHCLQLFYQNGGGPCYITSIGKYITEMKSESGDGYDPSPTVPEQDDFLNGLALLPKIPFPKPTIILAPDALLLGVDEYYTIQEQVLMQCGELQDRVGLIDVYDGYKDLEQGVISQHRNKIGNNFMKYGISYYPFLETTIVEDTDVTYANIDQSNAGGGIKLKNIFIGESALGGLANITADIENSIEKLMATPPMDFGKSLAALSDPFNKAGSAYPSWRTAFNGFPSTTDTTVILSWQLRVIFTMAWMIHELGKAPYSLANSKIAILDINLQKAISKLTSSNSLVISQIKSLYGFDVHYSVGGQAKPLGVISKNNVSKIQITDLPDKPANPYPADGSGAFDLAQGKIKAVFMTMSKALNSINSAAQSLLHQYNGTLENNNADYKKLMAAVAKLDGTLPPSAAMAGVFTLVDNLQGVWTSPANRNINSVIAPTVHINNDQQAALNVDALAGKSINAIRSFYGRGPAIIWGARTLDGNSQDWRYVSIRRTMIMIEQSVANAAEQLVFQANDASTWKTCESMINNFLFNLWTAGALQGATATDAYHVAVGLGKTMTPQDILNGIMRVQVKLAIVHPAEFIIITYEQQMAKSG